MGDSSEATDEVINCRLHIAGMAGPNCAGRIERALMAVPGVQNVVADHVRGEAIVRAAGNASVDAIREALDQAGYRLHAVDGDLDPKPEPEPAPEPEPTPAPEPAPTPVVSPEPEFADEPKRRSWIPSLRTIGRAAVYLFALSVFWVLLYRFVPPPATIHMIGESVVEGRTLRYQWVPLERISPNLVRAVIASEDGVFCNHWGFDFAEIERSWNRAQRKGNGPRGASTISQQTAKNAFLWVGRSYFRKGLESYFTGMIELTWGKRRIMEVYLNIIEFGPGIFGAEAASRHWFGKTAAKLTPLEAARLAAILPSPRRYRANPPGPYIADRGYTIAARAGTIRAYG
ncbi:MAG: monofunctional biosynthetic peptidoglycan transglycosylase, partial [Micropepsaceae bacterium]